MRIGRIITLAVPVILALAVAGAFAAGLRLVPLEVRQFDEDAALADAMHFEAEIFRDQWGVPRVLGPTDGDAAFALAYAHSEDDFATIQYALRAAFGAGDARRRRKRGTRGLSGAGAWRHRSGRRRV